MDFPSHTDDLLKQLHQIEVSYTNMFKKRLHVSSKTNKVKLHGSIIEIT